MKRRLRTAYHHPTEINVTGDPDVLEIWEEILEHRMEGFIYADGEVWVEEMALMTWRRARLPGWDANGSEVA